MNEIGFSAENSREPSTGFGDADEVARPTVASAFVIVLMSLAALLSAIFPSQVLGLFSVDLPDDLGITIWGIATSATAVSMFVLAMRLSKQGEGQGRNWLAFSVKWFATIACALVLSVCPALMIVTVIP